MSEPKWRQEFNALPEWAQTLVRCLVDRAAVGYASRDLIPPGMNAEQYTGVFLVLHNEHIEEWAEAIWQAGELADALSAPWPLAEPPQRANGPTNAVEAIADECTFDQPCVFGLRVEQHAVYCHNSAWPDRPYKCRRNRDTYKHEECPGFVSNPKSREGAPDARPEVR